MKLFGTDGIRGQANNQLTPELAFSIGRAAAWHLGGEAGGRIIIGRDPRLSGAMLEAALASGIASVGLDVVLVGIISTPGLARLAKIEDAVAGAMISASHNPMEDNGIKFVNSQGYKLEDAQEESIEEIYWNELDSLPRPTGKDVGRIIRDESMVDKYIDYLLSTVEQSLGGLRVLVDCANGAASHLALQVLEQAGARVDTIHASPDGVNINHHCGSTHPQVIAAAVRERTVDLGLALDGDADRLIAVDAQGNIVDGDKIMLICARHLQEQGKLKDNTLVVTVMSNMGLQLAAKELGIRTVATKVGDRNVLEEMLRGNYSLGGEQSGHIIFGHHSTSGDGLLSALQLMEVMIQSGSTLRELATIMDRLPQVLYNVRVASKAGWEKNELIAAKISAAEARLLGKGRVLVRPSGTEELIRVMLEGPHEDELRQLAEQIAATIKDQLG